MKESEVYCFLLSTEAVLPDRILAEYGQHFSRDRYERINKCKNAKRKKELICSAALFSNVMKRFGVTDYVIDYGHNGKPYLATEKSLFFNLSHSGDFIFLAVSGQEIGADIQKRTAYKESLAERICTKEEMDSFGCCPEDSFFRLWAGKEAYSKLTGKGLATDFLKINCSIRDGLFDIAEDGRVTAHGKGVYSDSDYEAVVTAYNYFEVKALEYVSL